MVSEDLSVAVNASKFMDFKLLWNFNSSFNNVVVDTARFHKFNSWQSSEALT